MAQVQNAMFSHSPALTLTIEWSPKVDTSAFLSMVTISERPFGHATMCFMRWCCDPCGSLHTIAKLCVFTTKILEHHSFYHTMLPSSKRPCIEARYDIHKWNISNTILFHVTILPMQSRLSMAKMVPLIGSSIKAIILKPEGHHLDFKSSKLSICQKKTAKVWCVWCWLSPKWALTCTDCCQKRRIHPTTLDVVHYDQTSERF